MNYESIGGTIGKVETVPEELKQAFLAKAFAGEL